MKNKDLSSTANSRAATPKPSLTGMREGERVAKLTDRLGYTFQNPYLALEALTHSTWYCENPFIEWKNNERLEFLGDAVLGLIASRLLMDQYPEELEGFLSKLRATVINEASFASRAQALMLGELLLLGRGEVNTGGREKPSILADAFEALAGAVFLDSGFQSTMEVFGPIIEKAIKEALAGPADHKTRLQEEMWKVLGRLPVYKVIAEQGPPHNRVFQVEVSDGENLRSTGTGHSKKQAEQEAAGKLRKLLTE